MYINDLGFITIIYYCITNKIILVPIYIKF